LGSELLVFFDFGMLISGCGGKMRRPERSPLPATAFSPKLIDHLKIKAA
jgi:hypothetical protein